MDPVLFLDMKAGAKRILKGENPQKIIFDIMRGVVFSSRKYRIYYRGFKQFDFRLGKRVYNRVPRSAILGILLFFKIPKKEIETLLDLAQERGLTSGRIHRVGSKWKIDRKW